ncbi:MAG: hypothetical protein ACFB4I_02235 [Cyanophyceae cyanobacterium]
MQLDAGDRLVAHVDREDFVLEAILGLFDSNGERVEVSSVSSSSSESLIDFTTSTSDTYFIGVSDVTNSEYNPLVEGSGEVDFFASTGDYEIEITLGSSPPPLPSFPSGVSQNLARLVHGTNGFVLRGIDAGDYSGRSVSEAGDINSDGIDDIIIGADEADPNGNYEAGESYVVFGSSNGFDANLDLAELDGTNGFVLRGVDAEDYSGRSVSGSGDVNGDGFDDLIIGAPSAGELVYSDFGIYSNGRGETYVVFGRSGFDASLDLAELDGTNGFTLSGIDPLDLLGSSVSEAGDVNGDGFDDFIIGAPGAGNLIVGYDFDYNDRRGESYVIFGPAPSTGLIGTEESNTLLDRDNIDLISGGSGSDTIAGLAGDDEIFGGNGDDVLRGDLNSRSPGGTEGGNDTLVGGAGSDRLGGKGGNDLLLGGLDDDQLYGDDVLGGGPGNNTLQGDDFSGGEGRDVFVLGASEGTDTIVDFEVGTDFIALDNLRFRDLSINGTNDALINFEDETLAIVQGVSPDRLDTLSFFPVSTTTVA